MKEGDQQLAQTRVPFHEHQLYSGSRVGGTLNANSGAGYRERFVPAPSAALSRDQRRRIPSDPKIKEVGLQQLVTQEEKGHSK